jgi:hypothetical protein
VWNNRAQTAEELTHEIAVLHRHCNTAGRDPAQIRNTAAGLFKDTFDDLDGYLRTAERYAVHVDLINVGPLPDNPDPVGVVPPPWRRAHTQTRANRLKGTGMRVLRATMIAVGIIQILTGAIFLVSPARYAELLHLQPSGPAWVNRLLAMCGARFVGYGIGMFVAARAPWRNRVWIGTMIAIQVVDFIAIAGYLADGVASPRQFPVVVLPLLWIALLGCGRTRAHAAVRASSPPESATADGASDANSRPSRGS